MNELIVNADGTVTCVGDAGSVTGIIAKRIKAATTPATYDSNGNELTPAIVPDANTLAVEVTAEELKTHAWRLPRVREDRLAQIRGLRDAKLADRDAEANHALTGRPGQRAVVDIEADRQVLRDLPPVAEAALAAMMNTDDMEAFLPAELS
jgi:hypothetical protein